MNKQGFSQKLKFLSRKFYCFQLRLLIKGQLIGKIGSTMLISSKNIIILLLCIFNEEFKNISQIDKNTAILARNNYIDSLNEEKDAVQTLCLILNLGCFLYFLSQYCLYLYDGHFYFLKPQQYVVQQAEQSEEEFLKMGFYKTQSLFYKIMSLYISIYQYILIAPIIYFCFSQLSHPFAWINILISFSTVFLQSIQLLNMFFDKNFSTINLKLMNSQKLITNKLLLLVIIFLKLRTNQNIIAQITLKFSISLIYLNQCIFCYLLGIIIIDCDYNYSIKTRDFLAKPFSSYQYIIYFTEIIAVCLVVHSQLADTAIIAFYFLLRIWFDNFICIFYAKESRFWVTFMDLYCGILAITYKISTLNSHESSIPSLLGIIYIPIFYKFSEIWNKWQDKSSFLLLQEMFKESREMNMQEVDRVIRLNLFQDTDSNKDNIKRKINLYNLLAGKKIIMQNDEIKRLKTLTYSQYQLNMIEKQVEKDIEEEESIKLYLKQYIRKIYQKKGEEFKKAIYLVYLLDVMNYRQSYWVEYIEISKNLLSVKQEQILTSIHLKFLEVKDIIQNLHNFNCLFDTSYQTILNFEDRIQKLYFILDQMMKQKVELLSLIKNKLINADMLIEIVKNLRNNQKILSSELNSLAQINNNNPDLMSLQICYLDTLSFSQKDIKLGFNSSDLINKNPSQFEKGQQQRTQKIMKLKQDQLLMALDGKNNGVQQQYFDNESLYSKGSCVIFATMENGVHLIMRKISKNFQDIFHMNPTDAQGKRVDIIMPSSFPIAQKHKQYLVNFFKEQDSSTNSMLDKVIFAQSTKGFIVPITVDIRLNYSYQLQEIGFSAHIKYYNEDAEYILFHSISFSFLGITSKLQNSIFSKHKFTKKFEIGQLFPFLYKLRKECQMVKLNTGNTQWEGTTVVDQLSLGDEFNDYSDRQKENVKGFNLNTVFEFLLIIENKKDNQQINNRNSKIMKIYEKEYSFYLADIQICKASYKELDNLSYLKISRIKFLNAAQNGLQILAHIRENMDLYEHIFAKQTIDRLAMDIENKYKTANNSFDKAYNSIQSIMTISKLGQQNDERLKNQSRPDQNHQLLQSQIINYGNIDLEENKNQIEFRNDRVNSKSSVYDKSINIKINEEILNFGNKNNKNQGQIVEIQEEEQSIGSVSPNPTQFSYKSYNINESKHDPNILNYQQAPRGFKQKIEQDNTSPYDLQEIDLKIEDDINNLSNQIKSNEDQLINNKGIEYQILSDNKRDYEILSDNKREQDVLIDNQRGQQIVNMDKVKKIINEDEFKQLFDKDFRNKNQSIYFNNQLPFNSPILSPQTPDNANQSNVDLIRNRQGSYQNSSFFDFQNKKDNSYLLGQNSYLHGQNSFLQAQNSNLGVTISADVTCSTSAIAQQKFYQDKESYSFMQLQGLNESKEMQKKIVHKQELKRNKKFLGDQMDNQSTTKSRESTTSTKRVLINLIRSQTQIIAIRIINIIGFLAFVTLAVVTLQQYLSIMDALSTALDNLTVQDWPQELQITINRSTKNLNAIQLIRQNQFTFGSKDIQQSFDDELVNRLLNSKDEFIVLVDFMATAKAGYMLFKRVSEYETTFKNSLIYNPANMTGISSRRIDYYTEDIKTSLAYSIVLMSQYIYRQARNPGTKLQEYLILTNLKDLVTGMKDIQTYFQGFQEDQDLVIKDKLIALIVIIFIISAACLFTILPLYSYIQKKRDTILNLFSSFSIQQIQVMIAKIRTSYYQNKAINTHVKHIPLEIQALNNNLSNIDQSHFKKQNLSQMTKLPRFNFYLVLFVIFSYSFLIIYPIVNKIIIQDFINQQANNILIIKSLNRVREYVLESSALTSFGLVMKLYPALKVVKLEQYINDIRVIMNRTNSVLTDLQFISNQAEIQNRHNEQDYNGFFFSILENDICQIIQEYPQYVLNSTKLDPVKCSSIQNGFLKKGLKLSIEKFTYYEKDLYQILEMNDTKVLNKTAQNLFKTFDWKEYTYFIDYIEETLNIQKEFILYNANSYYDYLIYIQKVIIIYQIVLMAAIFGIGWYIFSKNIRKQINTTKQYLQVINVNWLLENNYVLTFVKNNHKI